MTQADSTLPSAYDPTTAENHWYPIWEQSGCLTPSGNAISEAAAQKAGADGKSPYCIVIPPPNVTGALHMGHALTVTIEDTLIRWRRMLGHPTLWLPGVDHAGIATQMVVERDLAAKENLTRHDLGREKFLERVWAWKGAYGDRISKQLRVLGCSLDWTRERFTMDEQLSRAVREVFVRLREEGLIYRAERLVNWCPRCHTALSDLEVNHEDTAKGELWSFAYPYAEGEGEVVVATTRPETMLGDTAVAVHPDDERYQNLIGKHLKHPILGYAIPVVADAILVDPEFGTGAVKVTPAHDFNDFETGKRHKLALFNILDADAKVLTTPEAPAELLSQIDLEAWAPYAGLDTKAARSKVKADLEKLGLARGGEEHAMAIGGCQRCETVVEPSLSVQWWVETETLAAPALEAVKSGATQIIPEQWTKTYYHWMENIQDWCISRQLWWGHRIPAWYCLDCDPYKGDESNPAFGSDAEPVVSREAPNKCARCDGDRIVQDSDVLDTWFSSALWPFSTMGWPDKTPELKAFYPNAVMETGFDILFFWVARMMMMGCKFMGEPPFPKIYLHAMVRDKLGDKMSKTRGNVIDPLHLIHGCKPEEVADQFKDEFPDGFPAFGADATRFTLAAMSASGRDIKLSVERIAGYRSFANKIWNAARFVEMRLEGAQPPCPTTLEGTLEPADRWILHTLAETTERVNAGLEAFRFADTANAIYSFFWDQFCDWYIELVKARLLGDDAASKTAGQATLVYVLDQALRMLHPMMPFITEEIWQRLPLPDREAQPASIMLAAYPTVETLQCWRDAEIATEYELVKSAITGIRTVRSEANVKPSAQIETIIAVASDKDRAALEKHRAEISTLARVATLTLADENVDRPAQVGTRILQGMEVLVPLVGLVDFAEEAARLRKQLDKTQKEHDKIAKKLTNEAFLARAPEAVVTKDRARVSELQSMLAKLAESIARAESVG